MQASGNQQYFPLHLLRKAASPSLNPYRLSLCCFGTPLSRLQQDNAQEEALLDAYFRIYCLLWNTSDSNIRSCMQISHERKPGQ